MDDASYSSIFKPVIQKIMQLYQARAASRLITLAHHTC